MIGALAKSVTISSLCRLVRMSRQNYYRRNRQRLREKVDEELVIGWVLRERQLQPRLGGRKLLKLIGEDLEEAGIGLGRDRFFGLLRRQELLVKRRVRSVKTTQSQHRFRTYSNLMKELDLTDVHQAWVSDLTYIGTEEGFVYLSLVTDAQSRKVVGWHTSDGLEATGCVQALRRALCQLPEGQHPIHHSDRGTQYCCGQYIEILERRGLQISMTEENHCYENAKAERLNGILKQEYGLGNRFRTKQQARESIRQAIDLYNYRSPTCQSSIPDTGPGAPESGLMGKWKTHLAAQLDGLPMPFSTFPQAGPLPVLNIIHNVSTFDQDLTRS